MSLDIKKIRESMGLSQEELAEMMSREWEKTYDGEEKHFTQNMIFRFEKDPGHIDLDTFIIISKVFGESTDRLCGIERGNPEVPVAKDNWTTCVKELKERLLEYIKKSTLPEEEKEEVRSHIVQLIGRKFKIACIGHPDSGKSRMLNSLIGKNLLPTNWTPTTSAFILLKHIDDRPEFIGNDTVMVLMSKENMTFEINRIDDDEYCKGWGYESGDYDKISEFGAHKEQSDIENTEAIVVYVNSPILKNCDLIDLPGFGPNPGIVDENNEVTLDKDSLTSTKVAGTLADGFIYLSIANSFLYGNDIAMAKTVLESLPIIEQKDEKDIEPFGNVFFVASHALSVNNRNKDDLEDILKSASSRLWSLVKDHPYITLRRKQTGYEFNEDVLYKRFFTSEMDSKSLTQDFYDKFVKFTELLPSVQLKKSIQELDSFCEPRIEKVKNDKAELEALLDNFEDAKKNFKDLQDKKESIDKIFENKSSELEETIKNLRSESEEECKDLYNKTVSSEHILDIIDKNEYHKKEKDMGKLINEINSELESGVTQILVKKSENFKNDVEEFIKNSINIEECKVHFNVGRAFAAGLSSVAACGALAFCGNLGECFLAAKTVSFLTAFSVHFGGTAAAVAAGSAIGGPVILGITAATLAGITAFLALGGTWKKQISNKLIKQYEKSGVLNDLEKAIDNYWDDTKKAADAGMKAVENEWKKHLDEMKKNIEEFDEEGLKNKISGLEKKLEFYNKMSLQEEDKNNK